MALGPLEEHDEDACRGRDHCTMCMLCVFTLLNRVTKCKKAATDGEVSGTELHRKSRSQKLQHCSKATLKRWLSREWTGTHTGQAKQFPGRESWMALSHARECVVAE